MMERKELSTTLILDTGKKVTLRKKRIRDDQNAAALLGANAPQHPVSYMIAMKIELAKLLITKIDGITVPRAKLEDLDSLFDPEEFEQVLMHIGGKQVNPPKAVVELEEDSPKSV